jgi:hypothetical protein
LSCASQPQPWLAQTVHQVVRAWFSYGSQYGHMGPRQDGDKFINYTLRDINPQRGERWRSN